MKRRTILSMAAVLALAITMGAANASAQNPACCFYTIEAQPSIPPNCFPLPIQTEWGPGITTGYTMPVAGIYTDNVPPPCNPSFPFNWVRVLPLGPMVPLGGVNTYQLPQCGYVVTYTAFLDPNGCLHIKLW